MCMRAYQGKCPQLLFFSESGWRYPGLRQHRHRIFFPKQIWIKICLWGKNCTRNSDIMNIHATSVQYLQLHLNRFKFIAKIQTHHSTYEIRSHKSWIRVIFLHRWPAVENDEKNLNTFWFYRTNETWQTYQRFYPNAWLVEEGVWKCCRRRLICKKHLILTRSLW